MPDPTDLAGWTPVALSFEGAAPSIDWGDLRRLRFAEPFFHQTVERWAAEPSARLVRTELGALAALDGEASLDPCALIFHLSRCGSTLLSRLLGTIPGVLVLSEPAPLNSLLMAAPEAVDEAERVEILRLLVRALGRRRFGDERHYVLKLSSWNITQLALYRRAFPRARVIWLQRSPVAVAASLCARPPGWRQLQQHPALAQRLFGLTPEQAATIGAEEFCAEVLAALLAAARAADPRVTLYLDYAELPEAAWGRVGRWLELPVGETANAAMRELARYHAQDTAPRLFDPAAAAPAAIPEALHRLLGERALPIYRELDGRRQASLSAA